MDTHGRVCGRKVRVFKPDLGWPNEKGQSMRVVGEIHLNDAVEGLSSHDLRLRYAAVAGPNIVGGRH